MTRDRNNIQLNKNKISTVETGGKKEQKIKAEGEKDYDLLLRKMSRDSIDRFRALKRAKIIPRIYFNEWVDDLIQAELDKLEIKAAAKTAKK